MEIIEVLWTQDRPLSRAEIINLTPQKSWKPSSIHILLNGMLGKGAIEAAGFTKTGTHYGRTFAPMLTEAEYAAMQIQSMDSYKTSQSTVVKNIINALLDAAECSDETLTEIELLLKEKRRMEK